MAAMAMSPGEIRQLCDEIATDQADRAARADDPRYQPWTPQGQERRRQGPGDGLVYRTTETPPAAFPQPNGGVLVGDDAIVAFVAETVGLARAELAADYERQIAELRRDHERQIACLEGAVSFMQGLLVGKGADVLALPSRKLG